MTDRNQEASVAIWPDQEDKLSFRVLVSTLCDLRSNGWMFDKGKAGAFVKQPEVFGDSHTEEKERVRAALCLERDSQLRNPHTRAFIKSMEKRRLSTFGWVSIFNLMRDGRDLAAKLRAAASEPAGEARLRKLRKAIDPYLQFDDGNLDDITGLNLSDVWRYFRYTWVNAYLSTPGRKFWVLVRDRAAPGHPVIGIASFGNAVVHQGPRDKEIGWTRATLLQRMEKEGGKDWALWLQESLAAQFEGLYVRDFLDERVVMVQELKRPTQAVIERLRKFAGENRLIHSRDDNVGEYDRDSLLCDVNWLERAKTNLFRSKRAELLAALLEVRMSWQHLGFQSADPDKLREVLASQTGVHAIELLLRRVKSDHVGIDMLEITTCGAIAPYNHILGGKLVAMLLASPEVIQAYARRYESAPSVIASSLAGRPVERRPNLVYLGTTSLYGVCSSQYNRIAIPAEALGGRAGEEIRYRKLGHTQGYGTTHFSRSTSDAIEALVQTSSKDRRVNSIFGEGISPRLRKFRVGMDLLGLPSEKLLNHGSPRLVYGIALATNFREILLGRQTRPRYVLPMSSSEEVTRRISDFWMARWLSMRVENQDMLARVERDTLVYPIDHGARVVLPVEDEEPNLFSAIES